MGFIWVDSVWGTITKYTTIALVAGSIGFYQGCQKGMEWEAAKYEKTNIAMNLDEGYIADNYKTKSIENILEGDTHGYNK